MCVQYGFILMYTLTVQAAQLAAGTRYQKYMLKFISKPKVKKKLMANDKALTMHIHTTCVPYVANFVISY